MILKKLEERPLILFFLLLIFHYWSLMRYPQPFEDEAWLVSRAWSYLQTGLNFGPLDRGVFDQFDGYWTFMPWFPTWIHTLSLRIFGSPTLFGARIISLFFGMVLLIAVYLISKSLGGKKLAVISVMLVALSKTFLFSAHLARPDIIAAALGYSAIALLLYDKSSRWWLGLISGLLVGISIELHPNSVIFVPTLFALYLYENGFSFIRNLKFWGFIGGLFLGALIYLSMHVFPFPTQFLYFNNIAFSITHTPPILTGDISIILDSFKDTGLLIGFLYLFSAPLILVSVYMIMVNRENHGKIILLLASGLVLFTGLLIRNKFLYYGILVTPIIDIMLAGLFLQSIKKISGQDRSARILGVIPIGVIIGTLIINLNLVNQNHRDADRRVTKIIEELIDESDIIMGSQVYWFGLAENRYYSWETLIYFQRYLPGSNLYDAFNEFKPDIFILDDHLKEFISDFDGNTSYSKHLRIPQSELVQFFEDRAILISEFDGGVYGEIQVYRIVW